MAFKIAKCPACGADLNIETDKDYLFCQFCGAKLIKDDQKITIEHIERKIDEAEIERTKLEREEAAHERASTTRTKKICGILCIIAAVCMFIGFSNSSNIQFMLIGEVVFMIAIFAFLTIPNKNGQKRK